MSTRIVVYSPDGRSLGWAREIAARTGAEISEIRCPRYEGPFGPLVALCDRLTGRLPEITVAPAIGPVEWLVVGGPVRATHLAGPVRRFLEAVDHLPPVAGIFATRRKPGLMANLEEEAVAARPVQPPALVCLDATAPGRIAADRLARFLAKVAMIQTPAATLRAA